jgi:hypothetical protein
MVEVGEISIKGKVDSNDIDKSMDRIVNNFKEIDNQSNQTNATMNVLTKTTLKLGKSLLTIGTVGFAALTGLASKAPILSGTFAKMQINTMKLANTVGRQLKPAFESIATDTLPKITEFFNNSDFLPKLGEGLSTGISDIGNLINGDLDQIKNKIPKATALGAAIGLRFMGPKGLLIGAALGAAAGMYAESIDGGADKEGEKFSEDIKQVSTGNMVGTNGMANLFDANFLFIKSFTDAMGSLPGQLRELFSSNDADTKIINANAIARG